MLKAFANVTISKPENASNVVFVIVASIIPKARANRLVMMVIFRDSIFGVGNLEIMSLGVNNGK